MNLFIGNLNPETTAAHLRPLFEEFGEVVSAKVIMDNATGMSRGFGFVEMADKFHSFDAIDNIDGTFFEGNVISVKEAKQNGMSSGGGGSRSSGGSKPYSKPFGKPAIAGGRPRIAPRPRPDSYNNNNATDPNDEDRFNRL